MPRKSGPKLIRRIKMLSTIKRLKKRTRGLKKGRRSVV